MLSFKSSDVNITNYLRRLHPENDRKRQRKKDQTSLPGHLSLQDFAVNCLWPDAKTFNTSALATESTREFSTKCFAFFSGSRWNNYILHRT